jgi:phage-related protein (TIGR01555 family)
MTLATAWAEFRAWLAPPPPEKPKPNVAARIDREIDADDWHRLLATMGVTPDPSSQVNPFDSSKLRAPPGVGPNGSGGMAMDNAAFGGVAEFARQGLTGFFGGREGFIGYPELSILSLRPEYRSPAEIIATEATRKWVKFQSAGDGDKSAKIAKIKAEFERLGVQAVFRQVSEHDGRFGRAHLFIEFDGVVEGGELKTPIGTGADERARLKIGRGSLTGLRTVEPVWVWPINYDSINPLSEDWYRPDTWFVMSQEIHKTRLLTFISREVPDLLKPAYMFGGQSLTQLMMPVVDNWLTTRRAIGEIVKKFSFKVIYLNLVEALNSGNVRRFLSRMRLFTETQNNSGTMVLDKTSEEFVNVAVPLSGLDQLQAQAQEHMASLSRIPIIKLLGIQPAGLNASSAGELRAFADFIHSYQEAFFRPNLTTVLNLVQCSLFGQVDPDITFEFEPLTEEMSDGERAEAANQVISAATNAFESGLLSRADALKTLRSLGDGLGITIEDSMVDEAENEPPQPSPEELKAEAEMVRAENTSTAH